MNICSKSLSSGCEIRLMLLIAVFFAESSASVVGQVLTKERVMVNEDLASVIHYEYDFEIEVGKNWKERCHTEIDSHGIGILRVANLALVFYDDNPGNLTSFDDGLLHTEFADVNRDGFKDLVLCGRVLQHEDGKGES